MKLASIGSLSEQRSGQSKPGRIYKAGICRLRFSFFEDDLVLTGRPLWLVRTGRPKVAGAPRLRGSCVALESCRIAWLLGLWFKGL